MPTTVNEKLTRVKHLLDLASRIKNITDAHGADIEALEQEIQDLVTTGGQPNVIEEIQVNGVKQTVADKIVNILVATKVSELENDSDYQSETEVNALIDAAIEALKIGDYAKVSDLTSAVDRIATIEGDYLKEADKTELQGNIDGVEEKVDTLIGEDVNKSARTIASEETAKIVAGADTAYDTLKEIADWISTHGSDAATMQSNIVSLQNQLKGIDVGEGTVKKYVDDAISALNIGQYALAADLTALAARVTALESTSHEHSNQTVLDGITAEKVTAWDAAEANAKSYTDEKNTAMDTRVKTLEEIDHEAYVTADAAVLSDAKAYADGLIASDSDVTSKLDEIFGA